MLVNTWQIGLWWLDILCLFHRYQENEKKETSRVHRMRKKLSPQLHSTANTWTFTMTEDPTNVTSVARHFVNDITWRNTNWFTLEKNPMSVSTAIRHSYLFTIGETTKESTQERSRAKCAHCGERFRHTQAMKEHEINFHGIGKKTENTAKEKKFYACNVCGKTFSWSSALSTHKKIHADVWPYKCKKCSRAFKSYSNWWMHKKSHSKEKPFECDLCGQRLKRRGNLKRHILTQHDPEEAEECLKTSKEFENFRANKARWANKWVTLFQPRANKKTHSKEKTLRVSQLGRCHLFWAWFQEAKTRHDQLQGKTRVKVRGWKYKNEQWSLIAGCLHYLAWR